MAYNYNHIISSLQAPSTSSQSSRRPSNEQLPPLTDLNHTVSPNGGGNGRLAHSPVLLQPLPASLTLEKESKAQSELELGRQKEQLRRERELAEALQDQRHELAREAARESMGKWVRKDVKAKDAVEPGRTAPFVRPPQAYELYQAIDKKDLDFISRVRDHAFDLLLQKNAGEFPIVYAGRWGASHREVVIMLIGAFSRYVNNLEEDEYKKKEVQNTLKMLRTNLKLAIDSSLLPNANSHLLSSYLQVLIMSEGDAWVLKSVHDLGLLMRDEHSKPAAEAEAMVRKFSTKELRGVAGGVGDVEEYIANAALDLVIMSAWSVAAAQIDTDMLPTYTFARDLRTFLLLQDELKLHRNKLQRVNRRVRTILNAVEEVAGDTHKGVRGRLRDIAERIDQD